MRTALEAHPAVLLFSHRSYIDGAVVPVAMQDNRLPPVHMFGGVNLSFGVMGPLMRRAGMIFIRRNIAGDPLYKYVLKEYVGYVVEKRFNLSWSIEGTRSRTGKMLPPKLGLMSYVADAYLDGRSDDILLQGFRSVSTSCTRSLNTPPTRAAPKRHPRASAGSTTSSRHRASATTERSMCASRKRSPCGSTSVFRMVR